MAIKELNLGIVVDWKHKENLDHNTMVFYRVVFGHRHLVLKVSSTIDYSSMLMAHIYMGYMMAHLWILQLLIKKIIIIGNVFSFTYKYMLLVLE